MKDVLAASMVASSASSEVVSLPGFSFAQALERFWNACSPTFRPQRRECACGATMDEVRLFLVRVWSRLRDGDSFRASVRPLDRDQPLVFSQPEQVAAFLKDESDRSSERGGCDTRAAQPSTVTHPATVDPGDGHAER